VTTSPQENILGAVFARQRGRRIICGVIHDDEESLAWAAEDFGHYTHNRPAGVLRPVSAADMAAAQAAGLPLRARGQGHSTAGQAQISGGLVVDMRGMNTVRAVEADHIVVDAGARWSSVLAATLPLDLTPPVLTDYLELSVGGTLSAGGIGGATHQFGLQVDNVMEMEVLTRDGIVVCAPGHKLFDLVRGGNGDHGIILRAKLRLVPAETSARRYLLRYPDLTSFLADQRMLMAARRFDYLEGQAKPGWAYEIEAVKYYSSPAPDETALLAGLSHTHVEAREDITYREFLNRVAEGEQFLRSIGDWDRPHPWIDLFVPDESVDEFITSLTTETIGENDVVLIYPFDTSLSSSPLMPSSRVAFLVALLQTATSEAALARLLARNEDLRRRVLAAGGTIYLDWRVSAEGEGGTR
jgi:cytokinin dehydrogenase